ncbi:SGNH/GDSL hydrolase family protein [Myxococcota bacterium]|nr:SGNH/GDSL hydrolase family protein [Myxococcota bacterium]
MSRAARIVTVTDSLGMPRVVGDEALRWEEIWPKRVERALNERGTAVEIICCGARARTSGDLLGTELQEHVVFKRPDVVVVEVGVTDCAPRVFSKNEKRLLNTPVVPARVRDWIVQRRSAKRLEITAKAPLARVYTPPDRFEADLRAYARALREQPWPISLVILPIVAHAARMAKKSSRHDENVALYNGILDKIARDVDATFVAQQTLLPGRDVDAWFFQDGYHITPEGARVLAEHLTPILEGVVERHAKTHGLA